MLFTHEEIEIAKRLHQKQLVWIPRAGHYVYDQTGFCGRKSPFQENVFYILNYDYFIGKVGGVDRFREIMIWLPTWFDLRGLLRDFGFADEELATHLSSTRAIEQRLERLSLYRLLEEQQDACSSQTQPATDSQRG
ncbi:MAG: hypothetical protein GY768_12055 [Planctomycetaceae bacterium]|nr:hypothetical protein [Planctomycetaceae bacterium]